WLRVMPRASKPARQAAGSLCPVRSVCVQPCESTSRVSGRRRETSYDKGNAREWPLRRHAHLWQVVIETGADTARITADSERMSAKGQSVNSQLTRIPSGRIRRARLVLA